MAIVWFCGENKMRYVLKIFSDCLLFCEIYFFFDQKAVTLSVFFEAIKYFFSIFLAIPITMKYLIKFKKITPKKTLKTVSFVLYLSVSVQLRAQEGNTFACFPDPKSPLGLFAKREQHLYKTLILNEEQLKQIDTINNEYVLSWESLREDKKHSRKEKALFKKRLRDERDERFRNILTEEQRKRWNKIKQNSAIRKAKKQIKP